MLDQLCPVAYNKKLLVLRFLKSRSNMYKLLVFDQKITYNIVIPGSI